MQVPEPAWFKPTDDEFYARGANGQTVPNVAFLKEHFFKEGRLEESQAVFILKEATRMLTPEHNLLYLTGPIVGTSPREPCRVNLTTLSMRRYPRAICKWKLVRYIVLLLIFSIV